MVIRIAFEEIIDLLLCLSVKLLVRSIPSSHYWLLVPLGDHVRTSVLTACTITSLTTAIPRCQFQLQRFTITGMAVDSVFGRYGAMSSLKHAGAHKYHSAFPYPAGACIASLDVPSYKNSISPAWTASDCGLLEPILPVKRRILSNGSRQERTRPLP